ncbi:MAG: FAD-dependent thymidylate synthase [bacterium]|nr:FAD-dependent thymidylate synthase [Candidatus Margulisiibacteriota bacterium]
MKVLLAGYNLDTDVINDLKSHNGLRQDVTPETLSASYARISRDPRPIDELRQVARGEVEKARKSNSAIIFKMGHHSIAEHAVFNFDLIGISRLALEEVEKFRLCSYTEKSQRYQKLEDDFIVPEEVRDGVSGVRYQGEFAELIKKQNKFYHKMVEAGVEPEDARYVTSLATQGQVGLTVNARNLEFMLRRFASSELAEIRLLGQEMYKLVAEIAPSIILFTKANDFDEKTYGEIKGEGCQVSGVREVEQDVSLVGYSEDGDEKILVALVHSTSRLSYQESLAKVKAMSDKEKKDLIKTCFKHAEFYDRPQREFEYADLTYELVVSAACFAQLKRHRMATLTVQPYDPSLGVMIPESIKKAGLEEEFKQITIITDQLFTKLNKDNPLGAQYLLTNAHRRRVLFKTNVRELYHVSRLREDKHAQRDIQIITSKMSQLAQDVFPVSTMLIGGKDSYSAIYESVFGKKPKVLPEY